MARTETTPAILLRSVAYGDSDRIVTLLTAAHGKLGAMAHGARRSAKRFSGALEPYTVIEAELAAGRGELARLASARVVRVFPGILAELGRMSVAAAGLELVRLALADREPPDARLLPTIERFFELAERASDDTLRVAFALRMLGLAGLAPNLERCGRCGRPAPEGKAALFDPGAGAVVCRACGGGPIKLGGPLRAALVRAGTGAWDEVASAPWSERDGLLAARAVDAFAEHHLGKRLAAGEIVSQVREVERAYARERS